MENNPPVSSYETPDSEPWGVKMDKTITPIGTASEDGFYDTRDDMMGGTDTPYNLSSDGPEQSGANWYSAGDNAPVTNSGSGLDGERCAYTGVLSQEQLAS